MYEQRYTFGWNTNGSQQWTVLLVEDDWRGNTTVLRTVLIGEGLTEAKAKAIAMILSAEDPC